MTQPTHTNPTEQLTTITTSNIQVVLKGLDSSTDYIEILHKSDHTMMAAEGTNNLPSIAACSDEDGAAQ